MESLPQDGYLKFNPDTLHSLRKKFNLEKSEDINNVIDILDSWIQQQNYFVKKDFSRTYLENTIIVNKGSIERAKLQLSRLCTLKTLLPNFFEGYKSRKSFLDLKKIFPQAWLPRQTADNCRIHLSRVENGITSKGIFDVFKFGILLNEFLRAHDYNDGVLWCVDLRNTNIMDMVACINLSDLRNVIAIAMEGYDTRLKAVHFITTSKAVEVLINMLKQVMSAKLGNRIHSHASIDNFYKHITPLDILPVEYGGKEKPLADLFEELIDIFTNKEGTKYFEEMAQAGVIEALRPKEDVAKFDEQSLGIAGSFRTLSVD